MIKILDYPIHEVSPYINWIYFFHAWGFQPHYAGVHKLHDCPACRKGWVENFPEASRVKAEEAIKLYDDAQKMLNALDLKYKTRGKFGLYRAWSDMDNIVIGAQEETNNKEIVIPCLRQQTPTKGNDFYLCLSDFLHERQTGVTPDILGAFCTTVDPKMELDFDENDPYNRMLVQTLCDRLAEATAERMHEEVRKHYWGYAPDEDLTPEELYNEKYQGIRPAAGYPSLPDISINHVLEELLGMSEIGISLTENGMMSPHASVSGLMFGHKQAHYFNIGQIGEDQLADYAQRRGMAADDLRRYLIANLAE